MNETECNTGGRFAACGGLFAGGLFAGGPSAGGLSASGLNAPTPVSTPAELCRAAQIPGGIG